MVQSAMNQEVEDAEERVGHAWIGGKAKEQKRFRGGALKSMSRRYSFSEVRNEAVKNSGVAGRLDLADYILDDNDDEKSFADVFSADTASMHTFAIKAPVSVLAGVFGVERPPSL
jgi:hypothetical protein